MTDVVLADSGPVVRVDDTVRRPRQPWSASVHRLLCHLEAAGFDGAPRVQGIDGDDREVLTFIPGTDGRVARCYSDEALVETAVRIRRFHDAAADFTLEATDIWRRDPAAPAGNSVCHNDLNPANTIFRDGRPVAFIDWNLATPSTRGWDLSYAVRTFVPLYAEQDCHKLGYPPADKAQRLRLFCDSYGLTAGERHRLLGLVRRRLDAEQTPFARRCLTTLDNERERWSRALV